MSPGTTSTVLSTPLVTKLTGVASDDSELPLAVTDAVTVPRVTATVRAGLGFSRGANAVISANTRMMITSSASPMLISSVRRPAPRSRCHTEVAGDGGAGLGAAGGAGCDIRRPLTRPPDLAAPSNIGDTTIVALRRDSAAARGPHLGLFGV